jgi:hypothetical protein
MTAGQPRDQPSSARRGRKGGRDEAPACAGHAQLRPVLGGWQWRISFHGQVFGPWVFVLGSRGRARAAAGRHHPARIEVLP